MFGSRLFHSLMTHEKKVFLNIQFYKKTCGGCRDVCEKYSFVEKVVNMLMVARLKEFYRVNTIYTIRYNLSEELITTASFTREYPCKISEINGHLFQTMGRHCFRQCDIKSFDKYNHSKMMKCKYHTGWLLYKPKKCLQKTKIYFF